jgi:outer membrane lipoprotein-sorting protein
VASTSRLARWAIAIGGTVLVAALPALVGVLPARGAGLSAAQLLHRITASTPVGYSGNAEADGGLALPVTTGQFGTVADLLGGQTTLRAWWRGATDYRVDSVAFSGEVDAYRDVTGIWSWDYERNQATRYPDESAAIRLPRSADLLPPELGRRLLSEATDGEVRTIAAQRVAGQDAPGLRLTPAAPASTLHHVDVWADARTGLPLRVRVEGGNATVMDTRFLDVSVGTPPPTATAFTPPIGALVQSQSQLDVAGAVDRFGGVQPPASLAGLPANPEIVTVGAVRTYGRGVSEMVVGSVPNRLAPGLRSELSKAPGATTNTDGSVALGVGPLSVLVGPVGRGGAAWVLVGTVTPETLATALTQLPPPAGLRR